MITNMTKKKNSNLTLKVYQASFLCIILCYVLIDLSPCSYSFSAIKSETYSMLVAMILLLYVDGMDYNYYDGAHLPPPSVSQSK